MKNIIQMLKNKKETVLYLFFGVCTTLVNIICYFLLRCIEVNLTVSTVMSWVVSVLFAYVTNKIFVFQSAKNKPKEVMLELLAFMTGRVSTGLLDLVLMVVLVEVLKLYEPLIKVVSNILVILLNYILSKIWIFKK